MYGSVCWNLTPVCNKACEYCFRELNEEAQLLDTNLGILDNLVNMGVTRITFSGGEPFLYPNILDLIKAAHDRGIICHVITNGEPLDENNYEEYLQYVDKISFSCDSPREYINNEIGRNAKPGVIEDAYKHIKSLLPLIRSKYDSKKLKININSVITYDPSHEYEELNYMIKSIRHDLGQYDIDKWKILRFYPLRGKAKENKEIFWVPDEDFVEIKNRYKSEGPILTVDVRDIKELDDNLVVSPCGLLKKSTNGVEEILVDLKPAKDFKGGERHVQ